MKWLFREKFKVSEDKSKTDLPSQSCKQKCKKWDTKIASGFGIFAFLTIVGFVIYNLLDANTSCSGCGSSCNTDVKLYGNEETKCKVSWCTVTCDDIDEEIQSIAHYINKELQNQNCKIITLEINNAIFNQSKLIKGWLMDIKANVTNLTIYKCSLHEITESAFAGYPFASLSRLRIVNANIPVLKKESFMGLEALGDFSFCNYGTTKHLHIEEGALEGMKNSLHSLELSTYTFSAEDIINLTGTKAPYLPKLLTLVLSYNVIEELKAYSFSNAKYLVQLFLVQSVLTKIDEKAFRGLNVLQRLNLSMNHLETLQQGTFSDLRTCTEGIHLWGNNWQCNCSLQWLKEYYVNTQYINKNDPPLCADKENKEFEEVDFCPDPTSTTSSRFPPTTPTTEAPPTGYIKIKCQDQTFLPLDAKVDITHSVEIRIKFKNLKLQFHELEGDPLRVVMTTTEDLTDYHLLWFNADYKTETGCSSPVHDGMPLKDLKRNTTYSFSLLYGNDTEVSPDCTFCIQTEPEWKYRPWIKNKYQVPVIVVALCIGIFLILLTVFLTFLCIRQHPKVISGNKNVIIVKPKKTSVASVEDVPPREYERPAYWDSYLIPSSQGYLTPKYQRYAKVRYRPPLTRSISEWSVANTSNHYHYEDLKHLQALKRLRQTPNEIMEADVYDYRPPLPPPNASFKRPALQEELYSCPG